MPNLTFNDDCPTTAWFCVGYNVRLETNWTVTWSLTVEELISGGWQSHSDSGTMTFGLGQPVVTGGDLYKSFSQGTATNCVVHAKLYAINTLDNSLMQDTEAVIFQCAP